MIFKNVFDSILNQMDKNVEMYPEIKKTMYNGNSKDFEKQQIYNAENFMLDSWISTKFHVSGAIIAVTLTIISILTHPVSAHYHQHM